MNISITQWLFFVLACFVCFLTIIGTISFIHTIGPIVRETGKSILNKIKTGFSQFNTWWSSRKYRKNLINLVDAQTDYQRPYDEWLEHKLNTSLSLVEFKILGVVDEGESIHGLVRLFGRAGKEFKFQATRWVQKYVDDRGNLMRTITEYLITLDPDFPTWITMFEFNPVKITKDRISTSLLNHDWSDPANVRAIIDHEWIYQIRSANQEAAVKAYFKPGLPVPNNQIKFKATF